MQIEKELSSSSNPSPISLSSTFVSSGKGKSLQKPPIEALITISHMI
ncbi:MAG: hypothetical protein WBI82_15995 [Sphaerochaeta sp.]